MIPAQESHTLNLFLQNYERYTDTIKSAEGLLKLHIKLIPSLGSLSVALTDRGKKAQVDALYLNGIKVDAIKDHPLRVGTYEITTRDRLYEPAALRQNIEAHCSHEAEIQLTRKNFRYSRLATFSEDRMPGMLLAATGEGNPVLGFADADQFQLIEFSATSLKRSTLDLQSTPPGKIYLLKTRNELMVFYFDSAETLSTPVQISRYDFSTVETFTTNLTRIKSRYLEFYQAQDSGEYYMVRDNRASRDILEIGFSADLKTWQITTLDTGEVYFPSFFQYKDNIF